MTVIPIRGAKDAPKEERSKMETIWLTPAILESWVLPPFQAPLRLNAKVHQIGDELRNQIGIPVITGVITLGILPGDTALYLLDGQHRRAAALESGKTEFLADVRIKAFESMEEMAKEFLDLNTPISKKSPDDQLRALQESCKPLQLLTKECPFIGYRYIRANPESAVVGMAATLRRWRGSGNETPSIGGATGSAINMALQLTMEDAEQIIRFMKVAFSAWKKDIENATLWATLNMVLSMWLWRVLVLDRDRTGSRRYAALTADQFLHCLMAASANAEYVAWLSGRNMIERDRAPGYRRLRAIFIARLQDEMPGKIKMPQPMWMNN
jgi:hypothetical protein